MRIKSRYLVYAVLALVILLIHYAIPYTILRNVTGFTLYAFWTLLSLVWVVVTLVFVGRGWS